MTERAKHIYIDCDGVLVDFYSGFRNFCIEQGDPIPADWEPDIYALDTYTEFWPVKGLVWRRMAAFNKTDSWANLRPLASVRELLPLVHADWRVKCITQIEDATTHDTRREMLYRLFPRVFDEVIFTTRHMSKIDVILDAHSTSDMLYLIEDRVDPIVEAAESGAFEFVAMITQPTNKTVDHTSIPCMRFDGVGDAVKYLTSEV